MEKKRNYGIDLLRLIFMYMVCILHTLGQGGILKASLKGSTSYKIFWLIEILAYCACDGFAIISGYMDNNKPRKYEKIVEMWFQVFFYSFVITLILTLIGVNTEWKLIDIIGSALPIIFSDFWYFTAYFCLFFITPFLNKYLFSVDKKTATRDIIVLFVLFSLIGIVSDPFLIYGGYSALWLIILYCIGVLAKRIEIFKEKKTITLVLIWIICIIATWICKCLFGSSLLLSYVSPTVLISGLVMVVLFSRLKIHWPFITKISSLAFGIYLFQLNSVIWNKFIKGAFWFVTKHNIFLAIIEVFAFAYIIFAVGLVVEFLRSKLFKILKVSSLSKKIVNLFEIIINKTSKALK